MRIWGAALTMMAAGLAVVACAPGFAPGGQATGAALYADYCAACHGASGRGDGPGAEGLRPRPADLTRLAADNGGVFPQVRVMGKVYGYSRGEGGGGGPMPEFGPLMEGRTVLVETAPGVITPTPGKLVLLAEYVQSLAAKGAQ